MAPEHVVSDVEASLPLDVTLPERRAARAHVKKRMIVAAFLAALGR
jgi:hypothetical protein